MCFVFCARGWNVYALPGTVFAGFTVFERNQGFPQNSPVSCMCEMAFIFWNLVHCLVCLAHFGSVV